MDAPGDAFYRELDAELCQGDILGKVPHVHAGPPLRVLRPDTDREGTESLVPYALDQEIPDGNKFDQGDYELLSIPSLYTYGIVLMHGCEIDKPRNPYRTIALIRPLDVLPDQIAGQIRNNAVARFFYLPEIPALMSEAYVDFRHVSSIRPEYVDLAQRLASLTDEAVVSLMNAFVFYLTRRTFQPVPIEPVGAQ